MQDGSFILWRRDIIAHYFIAYYFIATTKGLFHVGR